MNTAHHTLFHMFILYLVKLAVIFTAYSTISTASSMKSPHKIQLSHQITSNININTPKGCSYYQSKCVAHQFSYKYTAIYSTVCKSATVMEPYVCVMFLDRQWNADGVKTLN